MESSSAGSGAPRLKALIVEDSEDDLTLLLRELARGGYAVEYRVVQTKPALLDALTTERDWAIVISDFALPSMTGFDVVAAVRELTPDVPCIVISGTIAEDAAVDVLRAGARDFVVKDRMARLLPAIRRELREAAERAGRYQMEESLRDTRARMQFVFDSIGIGTWTLDLRTTTAVLSEQMERLYGLEPGSFAGTLAAAYSLVHPADREQLTQQFKALTPETPDTRSEFRTVWPDESVHWILVIGRVVWSASGEALQIVGIGMDVTAQKELEQQVQQAQKMESIGSLAGGIAHDFNNILTVISGFAELAAERTDDPAVLEPLREIGTAAASATTLTRQLLTFSRRQRVTPQLLDLSDHIIRFSKILRRMVEEHVHLDLRLGRDLPQVRIDAGQLEQVLLNLVANARDAMPAGGTVTIETRGVLIGRDGEPGPPEMPDGRYVVLAVADSGGGIPAEIRSRVFDPFFTTKPAGQGTGLGLATVYGIVKQSGGEIVLHSAPGAGSVFRIYLPAATRVEGPAPAAEPDEITELAGTETVLVVEDNPALRRLAQRVLARYGYTVLSAQDGEEARQICDRYEEPVHAVLIDVIMPGDSGPTVVEWIVRRRPGIGIVYMSGYAGGVLDSELVTGRSVFLNKPFTALQLARAVRHVLIRR